MNEQSDQFSHANNRSKNNESVDSSHAGHVQRARDILEQHPHFRGHSNDIEIDIQFGTMILSGRLPSFYLKQQLQEVFRSIPEVKRIENHVIVVAADGVSSEADRT